MAAGEGASKVQLDTRTRNPFLPLWIRQQTLLSAALSELCALYPQVPVGRLEELLEQLPLTVQDDADFLDNGGLPDSFDEALSISVQEWSSSLAIDGLSRTRSFNACTDELVREITSELLAAESGRALLIFEPGDSESFPADPDDTRIVLRHDGYGNYSARDAENGEFVSFKPGTDSFYLAIGSQLKTEERSALGMQFEQDVKGIHDVLTRRAIEKKIAVGLTLSNPLKSKAIVCLTGSRTRPMSKNSAGKWRCRTTVRPCSKPRHLTCWILPFTDSRTGCVTTPGRGYKSEFCSTTV